MRVVKRRRAAEEAEEERLAGGKTIKTSNIGRAQVDSDDDDWD
jgi:hypothetical protein